ncbi:MAG: DUF427 domain-containing protein [Anaerolineae bacterium]
MPKAIWNGAVLAESDETIVVEGNHYFPPDSINREYFRQNERHTVCPWKGTASYYDVEVDGKVNRSAAWYYPSPKSAAKNIKGYIAFWNGVKVVSGDKEPRRGLLSLFGR